MVSGCDVWLNNPRARWKLPARAAKGRLPRLLEPEHSRRLVARRLRRHERLCHRRRLPPESIEEQDKRDSENLYRR
jgi:hypothetical protein